MTGQDRLVRDFLGAVAVRRGTPNFFDRFERVRIPSGGLSLHLDVIATDPARPTVVFMPGTNAYAAVYGEFLCALADAGFNIVGFDPRGHGRSDGRRGSYTVPELLADFRAALRHARERFGGPLVAAGSSQGGIAAFYLAAEGYPLAGALCHNVADLGDPRSAALTARPRLSRAARPWVSFGARLFPELPVPMSFYINLKDEPIRGLGSSADLLRTGALLVPYIRLRGLASLGGEPLPRPVEEVRTPVMILHGARDRIFPRDYIADIHARLTCTKRLAVYEDCHHYILFDDVDRVAPDAVAWLRETCG